MRGPPDPKPVTARWMMNAAQYYLARYASTEANLAAVLARKARKRSGIEPDEAVRALIAQTVAKLAQSGLIDDRSFAGDRARSLKRKGLSAGRARAALGAKGVGRELAGEALAEAGFDEVEQAITAARRLRLGPWARLDGRERDPGKDIAKLARRGFSLGAIRAAFARGTLEDGPD